MQITPTFVVCEFTAHFPFGSNVKKTTMTAVDVNIHTTPLGVAVDASVVHCIKIRK